MYVNWFRRKRKNYRGYVKSNERICFRFVCSLFGFEYIRAY